MNEILEFLQNHPLFDWRSAWLWISDDTPPTVTKAIIIGVVAWIGSCFKWTAEFAYKEVHRNIISLVYLDNTNHMFDAFSEWYLRSYPLSFRRVEAVMDDYWDEGLRSFKLFFRQFSDLNIVKYKGKYLIIQKSKDRLDGAPNSSSRYIESYTIQCLFGEDVLKDLIQEVSDSWSLRQDEGTGLRAIVTDRWSNHKVIHVPCYKRMDQVFVEGKEELLGDINNFLAQKELYFSHGITFKRSYLLYGPPGTGKTPIVFALASWLKRPVYYLNPGEYGSDDAFESFIASVEDGSIILIEDIDIFWSSRDTSGATSITFQSLLNVLDGLHSPNNVLIFMTTNKPHNFDEAFLRKGRMDYKMKIDHPSKSMVQRFVAQFYDPDCPVTLPPSYKGGVPMVDIQDICIKSKTAEEALNKITNYEPIPT